MLTREKIEKKIEKLPCGYFAVCF